MHSCVWAALEFLILHHGVEVRLLPITSAGFMDLEKLDETLMSAADLIVCEHLNSEIGVMQPVAKIGKKLIRFAAETGLEKPIFVVDAAASAVTELVGVEFQKCDLLSISAEKIGGLSGSGLLLKREGIPVAPLIGGSQEWGRRGGTENVVGILALQAAYADHLANQESQNENLKAVKAAVAEGFSKAFPHYRCLTPTEGSGLHVLNYLSPEVPANLLVVQAD